IRWQNKMFPLNLLQEQMSRLYSPLRCQVDEQWFDLSADLLRKALAITPVIPAQPFELPPSGNTVVDFVNELGYPEPVEIVSNIRVNYVYQPWRAILTLINQCLTGKTSGSDKPRHPGSNIILTQGKPQSQSEEPKEESNSSPLSIDVFQFVPKAQQESIPQEEDDDPDLELAKKMSLEAHQEKGEGEDNNQDPVQNNSKLLEESGKGNAVVTKEQVAHSLIDLSKKKRTTDQFILVRRDQTPHDSKTKNPLLNLKMTHQRKYHESSSTSDSERTKSETEAAAPKDLIKKYSVLPGPESVKNQESEKKVFSRRLSESKKEQEALIADEDAMDKEVADKVKDHKRKHDSDDDEDDDDDEGPSAGSNQGRSTKRRRSDSAASGSAQPPPKDDDQSSKKPRESDASASKQHPALTLTGWQITDTRDAGADSSMHRSDPESEHSEQSSDDIPMQDEGNDSDMEDTDNAHIPKVMPIPPNDFPEPENNWANTYATTYKVPEENKLQRKTYDIGSFIKWFCRRTGKKKLCKADLEGPAFNLVKAFHKNNVFLQYQMDECHKLLTNKVDLSNPEGHQILRNIYEPLPLGGPPGQVFENTDTLPKRDNSTAVLITKIQDLNKKEKDFKNLHPNDFEDLFLLNIQESSPTAQDRQDLVFTHQSNNMDKKTWWIRNRPEPFYRDRNDQRNDELNEQHKFSEDVDKIIGKTDHKVKDFHLFEYNKGMETRKCQVREESKDFISCSIKKRLQIRRNYRSPRMLCLEEE
ncbi:hypothetical protein Tco_1430744, partial [Tanacetum coccineum]